MSEAALAAMMPCFREIYANPSSLHSPGQRAAEKLAEARETFARLLNVNPREITFTSGETITYQPEQWDDYAYDGKAVIVKLRSAWVGIYNFDTVFCVELKPV